MTVLNSTLPEIRTLLPGPRATQIIARDRAALSPSYTRDYPFVMARGEGAIVEDVDCNRFLDFNAGIAVCATGHSHPRIVEAIRKQAEQFLHYSGTDFYYESTVSLAEQLVELAPVPAPSKVYFGNSGTEAVEASIKMARYSSGRDKFIAFFGGFHGRTIGSLSLTGSKSVQKKGFGTLMPGVFHVPYPNPYRSPLAPEDCARESVRFIENTLFRQTVPAEEVAAIVVEPIQGEGGYLVPPANFFHELQELARRYGILIVADEVQSGMGRTGKMFASEHFGLQPDIVAIAKGIASGLPLSATIARDSVMNWKPGAHASTFGGNPVAVAAASATLDLLQEELVENARRIGDRMMTRMLDWPKKFPHVGEVRGLGLMIGFELVKDQQSRESAPELRNKLIQMAFQRGLLILGAGQNTVRLCPPLVINADQADFAVATLEGCLKSLSLP
jgi:4-aminobutyrate aminotransferase